MNNLNPLQQLNLLKEKGFVADSEYQTIRERIEKQETPPVVTPDPVPLQAKPPEPDKFKAWMIIGTLVILSLIVVLIIQNDRKQKQEAREASARTEQITVDSAIIARQDSIEGSTVEITKAKQNEARQIIRSIKPTLRFRKDDFNGGWYEPASAPKYVNRNGLYAYFNYKDEKTRPGDIYWTMQFYGDDWLFIKSYIFLIDGKQYSFVPGEVRTDSGNGGMVWEWFNEQATPDAMVILRAISTSKTAKVRMLGSDYRKDVTINEAQKLGIKRILMLHDALETVSNG